MTAMTDWLHNPEDSCGFSREEYNAAMRNLYGSSFEDANEETWQQILLYRTCPVPQGLPSVLDNPQLAATAAENTPPPRRPAATTGNGASSPAAATPTTTGANAQASAGVTAPTNGNGAPTNGNGAPTNGNGAPTNGNGGLAVTQNLPWPKNPKVTPVASSSLGKLGSIASIVSACAAVAALVLVYKRLGNGKGRK